MTNYKNMEEKSIVFTTSPPIKDIVFTKNQGSPIKEIVFTSKLYYKPAVIESLKKAIENCHIEDSLFWAYELYISGFEDETINILCDHAAILLSTTSPFVSFSHKKQKEHKKKREPQVIVTLVKNLIAEYKKKQNKKPEAKRFLAAKLEEAEPYIREPIRNKSPYRMLRIHCTCQIESIYLTNEEQCELLDAFRNEWLKYAAKSPIWRTRIENMEGAIEPNGSVVFPDEDLYEAFLEKYGYEPDEQGVDIYRKCLGLTVQKIQ